MGFWDWMGRIVGIPDGPSRTFNTETVWSPAGGPVDLAVLTLSGRLKVGRAQALSVPTVLKGRNLLCSIATLPLGLTDKDNRPVSPAPMFEQYDKNVPNVVHLAMTVEDLVFDAIAWWRVTARASDGYPMHAERLDPGRVRVDPPDDAPLNHLPSGITPPGGVVRVDGQVTPYSDLIRFDSPNPAVLEAGRAAIQRALLIDAAAAMYAGEPPPREFFRAKDGLDPEDEAEIDAFLADVQAARKERSTAYLPSWVEREDANNLSPAELQLAELQKSAGLAIANAMGIEPEELGISTTSRTYANDVDRRRNKINDVLAPYMRAITDRLSMGDVTKRGQRATFNLDDYMKSNPTERVAYYKAMRDMGAMDVPEIRKTEGLPPTSITEAPAVDGGGGTVTPLPPRGVAASRRQAHGFDLGDFDSPHQFTMTTPGAHQFTVDSESRTITGLAVPYGAIGYKYGMPFRFRKGSLKYADVSRVKHFKDHVTPVGKHLEITETDAGPVVKMSVSKGPVGDELLQLADDGVYDGLSVGVDFSIDPEDGDIELMEDGVYDVLRADWRETSTTAMPAFDDARVTKVAASRTTGKDNNMKCDKCQQVHAPGVTDCVTTSPAVTPPEGFTADDVKKFQDLATLFGMNPTLPEKPAAGPSIVDPTKTPTARTEVQEPDPYRFDRKGNILKGSHDFSTDLYAAFMDKDETASKRATEFVRRQFAVATGDVNELNPPQNRPEMYVDQRQFRYPLWEAIRKGTLDNITPFLFPKFSSASGLVGNHTEGVEPTPGTFVTTNQTVTPTAISGKAEINREVWDQGGSPQVSNMIWQKMLSGWFEALEAFAVSILDAATPTAIALTAGAQDSALVDQITEQLALLQFIRGGYAFEDVFTQVDLYKALVNATATDGRKLLPALNPANADGTARTRWAGLDVNGTAFLFAWALSASGTVVASSYLFDPQSVHGWASTPQRLDFQYQVKSVDIGIWGYKAGAISDITGVREITYDPVA